MKKLVAIVFAALLLVSLLASCAKEPVKEDPFANIPETPLADFQYEENEDGGIMITWYLGSDEYVRVPEQIDGKAVTKIRDVAFIKNKTLIAVKLPDTIVEIGGQAFEDCEALTTIVLPANLRTIGKFAFRNCKALKEITIPDSVTDIYMEAFAYSGLEHITLGAGLTRIRENVFGATNIKEIDIPSNIQTISYGAFSSCPRLETVILHDGLQTIDSFAFGGKSKLKEIVIPKTVTVIDAFTFDYCASLEKIMFEGDAPSGFEHSSDPKYAPFYVHYTIYYHEGAKGFTSPEWSGCPTDLW